jgi:hypothetical protein
VRDVGEWAAFKAFAKVRYRPNTTYLP